MFDAELAPPNHGMGRNGAVLAALISHVLLVVVAVGRTTSPPPAIRQQQRDTIRFQLTLVEPTVPDGFESPRSRADAYLPDAPTVPDIPPEQLKLPALSFTEYGRKNPSLSSVRRAAGTPTVSTDSSRSVFHTTEVDEIPRLIGMLRPHYPDGLQRAQVSGRVQIEYVVGINGRMDPRSVRVVVSSHPGFLLAALDALRGARFRPARKGGRTVPVLVQQTIRFRYR